MIKKDFAKVLEQFINEGVEKNIIPSLTEKSVRVKHYYIRKTKSGFVVFDTKQNKQIAYTNFISSAVAIAKSLAEGKNIINHVLYLDRKILKNYNDAIFYKNVIQNSKDPQVIETRRARLELALEQTTYAKQNLEDFIFQKINN
jgi:hypothetical protein